jgi:hypothetical protein
MSRARNWGVVAVGLCGVLGCEDAQSGATPASSGSAAAALGARPAETAKPSTPADDDRAHAVSIGTVVPPDVDPTTLARLKKEGKTAEIQALYDQLSWQSFVALNWPTDDAGKTKSKVGEPGGRAWMSYRESFDVFFEDGAAPKPWGSPRALPAGKPTLKMAALAAPEKVGRNERLLFTVGSKPRRTTADELDQAFTYPLWDQSGNIVFYEVLMNRSEFEYIDRNVLYNIDGQIEFSKKNPGKDLDPASCNHPNKTVVVMPSGKYGSSEDGAIEVKAAWKLLTKDDIAERYIVADGRVPKDIVLSGNCTDPDHPLQADIKGQEWKTVKLGLVGFHISHKTESGPQWVWSTFEHVDNLAVDGLEAQRYAAEGKTLKPTFNDPGCATCVVNACAAPPAKSQLERVIPIDLETAALNAGMQRILGAQGSVLRYYQLIGTQYPTAPDAIPTRPRAEPDCANGANVAPINLPESVDNKAGGKPRSTFLTNLTMESFFQQGAQTACNQVENGGNCPAATPTSPMVFATESCIGCHSSSSIAVSGKPTPGTQKNATQGHQLTADFSWLLSQKAYWKKP